MNNDFKKETLDYFNLKELPTKWDGTTPYETAIIETQRISGKFIYCVGKYDSKSRWNVRIIKDYPACGIITNVRSIYPVTKGLSQKQDMYKPKDANAVMTVDRPIFAPPPPSPALPITPPIMPPTAPQKEVSVSINPIESLTKLDDMKDWLYQNDPNKAGIQFLKSTDSATARIKKVLDEREIHGRDKEHKTT